jgi:ethanolamine utilization microcompartment shell protein EutS
MVFANGSVATVHGSTRLFTVLPFSVAVPATQTPATFGRLESNIAAPELVEATSIWHVGIVRVLPLLTNKVWVPGFSRTRMQTWTPVPGKAVAVADIVGGDRNSAEKKVGITRVMVTVTVAGLDPTEAEIVSPVLVESPLITASFFAAAVIIAVVLEELDCIFAAPRAAESTMTCI